jgi:hypothetical protein
MKKGEYTMDKKTQRLIFANFVYNYEAKEKLLLKFISRSTEPETGYING